MADPKAVQDGFAESIHPGDIVWDIGAYEGRYTSLALSAGARVVVAFEPRRETWQDLTEQYQEAPVDVLRVACYSEALPGRIEEGGGGPSTGRFLSDLSADCWAFPVDVLREDLGTPDVVKVDVEGAEVRVLDGAEETLREVRAALVEVHANPVATGSPEDYGDRPEDARALLEEAGLEVRRIGKLSGNTYHLLGVRN